MNYRTLVVAILFAVSAAAIVAGASAAEGASQNRGTYLSRGGYIVHPDEIKVEQYIAQRDYDYPLPEFDDLNVITASGINGENAYVLVGLKGKKVPFSDLPPLNITFCIDRSGSMNPVMPWVKSSFYIFIDRVRIGDIVSLVDMNTDAQTLISPTQILSNKDRTAFKRQVDQISATGGTDVYAGIEQSYREVEKNYHFDYVNRVVILTDGMHNFGEMINKDILDLASEYRKKGINISSVLLGIEANTGLMVDVAIEGGGSSRFVSDHDEMVKIFETELDRMLVPAARELKMRLVLADGVDLKNTWGYRNNVNENTILYSLPTLHNGDYETLFAELLPGQNDGMITLGSFYLDYLDLENNQKSFGPYKIDCDLSSVGDQIIADPRVREAEGYLALSRGLIDIGGKAQKIGKLQSELSQYGNPSPQRADVVEQIKAELAQNLELVDRTKNYLTDISISLGGGKYEQELEILQNYNKTFTEVYRFYADVNETGGGQ